MQQPKANARFTMKRTCIYEVSPQKQKEKL